MIRRFFFVSLVMAFITCTTAISSEHDHLDLARRIAETVERTARHEPSGIYASRIDTHTGLAEDHVANRYANWYLPGLWMLYWKTGDAKYLEWIERHSAALWGTASDPKTGLPYMEFSLAKQGPIGSQISHRIQYQNAAYGQWNAYLKSLSSANKYQVIRDAAGQYTVVNGVPIKRPDKPFGMISTDYFGCLDLRIPYALGVIEERPELFDAVVGDFQAHHITVGKNTTGLWSGTLTAMGGGPLGKALYRMSGGRPGDSPSTWRPGMFLPSSVWTATIADDTYTGLILYDLTGRRELFDIVEDQTRLAVKFCMHPVDHFFPRGVDSRTGRTLDPKPRYHTNWEWALTLFILYDMTGDDVWLTAGEKNYRWLMENVAHQGNYSQLEGNDWNTQQLALLCLFRYHQTGDERYLDDAKKVADWLTDNRLVLKGDDVYVGTDRYMDLRDAGDFIAMLVCLSDKSLPVVSSRYFLFPVGIRSPVFPVFKDAFVSRYYTRRDGVLVAQVKGGHGTEDIYVMDLSGVVQWVQVNGRQVNWHEKKVAGHRYIVLPDVELGKVTIEILS